jgi:hypothetical protein
MSDRPLTAQVLAHFEALAQTYSLKS